MLPVLTAYLGHANLSSTEEYLTLAPGRFWKQLAKLGPAREPRRDIATSSSPETR